MIVPLLPAAAASFAPYSGMRNALNRRPTPVFRLPPPPTHRHLVDRPPHGSAARGIGVAMLLSAVFWVGLAWAV